MHKPVQPLRAALGAFAALMVGAFASSSAQAQAAYPNQSIKFVVPYSPGGLPDTVARIVAARLQERVGQSVVIENRPGANGAAAAAAIAAAPADGYTFMVTDGSLFSVTPHLVKQLSYNPKDFVPVSLLARAPLFLAVHPNLPAGTFREFVDYVKARPGQINYGSSGLGSIHHLSMEAMKSALQLQMAHVPYRGTGQSVPALLGGHVEVLFSAYPSLVGAVDGKRVKLLVNNSNRRSAQAPDVPAMSEFIPDFDLATMVGIFARVGTPQSVIDKIAAEASAVSKMPETGRQFATNGVEPIGEGPEGLRRALDAEANRVGKIVQSAGIQAQ